MTSEPEQKPVRPRRSRRESTRMLLAGVLAALAVAFAFLNLSKVEVNWILTSTRTPLIIVIAVSLLVGVLFGYLAARRTAKRPSR